MNQVLMQRISMTKERLKTSLDNFIIDSLTGCYNRIFLNEYLINELTIFDYSNLKSNPILIYIKIDNIMDINIKYSNKMGDETIANLSYLLKELISDNEMLFKDTGPNFVILSQDFSGEIVDYVRNIQNRVKKAEIFIEPITVSCALVTISEIEKTLTPELKASKIIDTGTRRINFSRELGNSSFIDKDTIVERNFFGSILITEKDPLTLSIMKSFFEENRYNVHTANDGLAALNLAKQHKYDAIIADRYINKIDGLTLKKYINESSMNMNTMFLLTVQSKNLDIVNKSNLISIDFLFDKPIILEELLGIIKRETEKKECMLL